MIAHVPHPMRTVAAVACLSIGAFAAPKRLEAGERIPDSTVESLDGKQIRVTPPQGESGKLSVIVFLDPDQEASRRVLADLEQIHAAIGATLPEVRWIAIASGGLEEPERSALGDAAKARSFITFALDPERKTYAAFGVVAVPTTFVVGADAIVTAALPGRSAAYRKKLETAVRLARGETVEEEAAEIPESDESKRARRLVAAARNLLARRRHEEAVTFLRQAAQLRPDDAAIAVQLGDALLDLRRGAEAAAAYDRALAIDGTLRHARNGRACAISLSDDLGAGEAALAEALKKPPRTARLNYFMGLLLERRGDVKGAADAFKTAYETLHARGEE